MKYLELLNATHIIFISLLLLMVIVPTTEFWSKVVRLKKVSWKWAWLSRFVSNVSPIYYNNTGMQWRDLKKNHWQLSEFQFPKPYFQPFCTVKYHNQANFMLIYTLLTEIVCVDLRTVCVTWCIMCQFLVIQLMGFLRYEVYRCSSRHRGPEKVLTHFFMGHVQLFYRSYRNR